MKKFFLCCLIVIVALFLGFTTYYFVANKEQIHLVDESVVTQKRTIGESFGLSELIVHKDPYRTTKISIELSDPEVVSYDEVSKIFKAEKAGHSVLTITPSNKHFGPFIITITVGDGSSVEYPLFIKNAEQLRSIGSGAWTTSMHYELVNDIYLTNGNWSPIDTFSGTFVGNGFTIYDMKIDSTTVGDIGFISKLENGAYVKSVNFDKASITSYGNNVGVVVGSNLGLVATCKVTNSTVINHNPSGQTGMIVGDNQVTAGNLRGISARVAMCGVETSSLTANGFSGGIAGKNRASVIENCYVSLSKIDGAQNKFGGIVGINESFSTTNYSVYAIIVRCHAVVGTIGNIASVSGIAAQDKKEASEKNTYLHTYFAMETENKVGTAKEFSTDEIMKVSLEALKNKATYQTYDFTNVWTMGDSYAVIDFLNPYITTVTDELIINGGEDPVDPQSADSIYDMILEMKANPNSGKTYTISSSGDIDVSTAKWKAIEFPLGTQARPFTCRLIVANNCYLTFSNFQSLNSTDPTFFGYVGSGAYIQNVRFSNATTDVSNVQYSGVLASQVKSGATIKNCQVYSSSVSGGNYIGLIASLNEGEITNCSVAGASTLTAKNLGTIAGGIAGKNLGNISKASVGSLIAGLSSNANGEFGGVAGVNSGIITDSSVSGIIFNLTSSGSVNVGGIAGTNERNINLSTVNSAKLSASTTNQTVCVGGVAGLNNLNANISQCKVLDSNLLGYYVGGISAFNSGNITRSTAGENYGGTVSGVYAGGLVSINKSSGSIDNCLVGTTMATISASKLTCGFAYKLEENSIIKTCYTYAKFSGNNGDRCLDTETPYRNWFMSGIWQNLPMMERMGTIENSLITSDDFSITYQGYGTGFDVLFGIKQDITVKPEEAKGSDGFAKFLDNGFMANNYWTFSSYSYPKVS